MRIAKHEAMQRRKFTQMNKLTRARIKAMFLSYQALCMFLHWYMMCVSYVFRVDKPI